MSLWGARHNAGDNETDDNGDSDAAHSLRALFCSAFVLARYARARIAPGVMHCPLGALSLSPSGFRFDSFDGAFAGLGLQFKAWTRAECGSRSTAGTVSCCCCNCCCRIRSRSSLSRDTLSHSSLDLSSYPSLSNFLWLSPCAFDCWTRACWVCRDCGSRISSCQGWVEGKDDDDTELCAQDPFTFPPLKACVRCGAFFQFSVTGAVALKVPAVGASGVGGTNAVAGGGSARSGTTVRPASGGSGTALSGRGGSMIHWDETRVDANGAAEAETDAGISVDRATAAFAAETPGSGHSGKGHSGTLAGSGKGPQESFMSPLRSMASLFPSYLTLPSRRPILGRFGQVGLRMPLFETSQLINALFIGTHVDPAILYAGGLLPVAPRKRLFEDYIFPPSS